MPFSESNIDEIIYRYKQRETRGAEACRKFADELVSFSHSIAIRWTRFRSYVLGKKRLRNNRMRTGGKGQYRYPYSRRLPANGPPLGDDTKINIQTGEFASRFAIKPGGSSGNGWSYSLLNMSNTAPYLFMPRGMPRTHMRDRPLPAYISKRAISHMKTSCHTAIEHLLMDADTRTKGMQARTRGRG